MINEWIIFAQFDSGKNIKENQSGILSITFPLENTKGKSNWNLFISISRKYR